VLALGGWTFSGPRAAVEAYTPGANSWQTVVSLSTGRNGLAAATVDGKVYVIGGYTTGVSDLVEVNDPAINTWRGRAALPTARALLAAAVVGGKIYAIGGRDNNGQALQVVEEYDPQTDRWRDRAPMPTARWGAAAAVGQNGRIYVFGGATAGFPRDVVEEYDPQANSWRTMQPLSSPREGAAAVTGQDGRIYLLGGYNGLAPGDDWLSTVEAYEPTADTWTTCAGLLLNRGYLAGVRGAGSTFYALGGAREGGLTYVSAVEAARFPLPRKTWLPVIVRDGGGARCP
jgi:N-acetylneuraminic acid mutarotase